MHVSERTRLLFLDLPRDPLKSVMCVTVLAANLKSKSRNHILNSIVVLSAPNSIILNIQDLALKFRQI